MKFFIILLALFLINFSVLSTQQEPEIFFINGHLLLSVPITDQVHPNLPLEIGNKIRANQKGYSTSCYRGYIGSWMLHNDSLYLIKLVDYNNQPLSLSDFFPNSYSEKGVFAEWYDGYVRAGTADMAMMGYSDASKALRFRGVFKNGILQKQNLFISSFLSTSFVGTWKNSNNKDYNLSVILSLNLDKANGSFLLDEKDITEAINFTGKNGTNFLSGIIPYQNTTLSYQISVIGVDSLLFKVRDWRGSEYPINMPRDWILTKEK